MIILNRPQKNDAFRILFLKLAQNCRNVKVFLPLSGLFGGKVADVQVAFCQEFLEMGLE